MSEFTFLYRGSNPSASPEQMQKTMQKWVASSRISRAADLKSSDVPG